MVRKLQNLGSTQRFLRKIDNPTKHRIRTAPLNPKPTKANACADSIPRINSNKEPMQKSPTFPSVLSALPIDSCHSSDVARNLQETWMEMDNRHSSRPSPSFPAFLTVVPGISHRRSRHFSPSFPAFLTVIPRVPHRHSRVGGNLRDGKNRHTRLDPAPR